MKVFKKLQFIFVASVSMLMVRQVQAETQISFSVDNIKSDQARQDQNLVRAMALLDRSMEVYFSADGKSMHRFYNPDTEVRSEEKASVWMYSASIEAVNAILHGLKAQKERGNHNLFDKHYKRYADLLVQLHENAAYYLGTFNLISFTQSKDWTVYAVDRAKAKGAANVTGVLNVYDDQMWLIRELIEAYHLTGKERYLKEAEYLTTYVLDGWDCTLDDKGNENGGIPWGPGYVTKHACSNAPMISPLVWLHEIYKKKNDQITYNYIDAGDKQSRRSKMLRKADFYLDFAKRIYAWQKIIY
ncbi:glycoside hydrolase family 76 protein [Sphingobacterium sp. E70]|uniref:glycoside hydrolase family 76 protein n=1 Tax=Sphingobacterium sp. E70 TaxID=2853439 RepID=UPI00211CAC9A|nr:glycoside hydrolase family 76 protein [Sphingobacterium sp. E70]ULT23875.1 glycoside hydrolase family 76 protein [Sphingobacterium sp. E70]